MILAGTRATATVAFTDDDGDPVDPATVKVRWRSPVADATDDQITYGTPPADPNMAIEKLSTGVYRARRKMAEGEGGTWVAHWTTDGTIAVERVFYVAEPTP